MSRYRPWYVRRWNTQPFRSLDALDRMLCLAIELGPYSTAVPGVSAAGLAAMQEATRLDNFKDRVAALQQRQILLTDLDAGIFVVLDAIDRAEPPNPNAVSAWRKAFKELPESVVLGQIDERVRNRLVSYGQDHPARSGINTDEPERGGDEERRDPYAYVKRWDPDYQPSESDEHSSNLQETLQKGSCLKAPTFDEPETGSGSGSGPEAGVGREPDCEIATAIGPAPRKGERKGDPGETIGGNLRKYRGGIKGATPRLSAEEVRRKIAAIAKMKGPGGRPSSGTKAGKV